MINEICAEIKNYFTYEDDRHIGDWTISNNILVPSLDFPTDYIRIIGSRLNDGIHKKKNGAFTLKDESFHGGIWIMSPPDDFLSLVAEIEAWQTKNGNVNSAAMSPFYSESFGGYSYSKAAGSISGAGTSTTWQSAYAARLNIYRKIRLV